MHDIIIIGAGCAGLTAAIYAQRAGLKTTILEKNFYGGQISITDEVENYPGIKKISGIDLAVNLYNQAIELGTTIHYENVIQVDFINQIKIVTTEKETYKAKTVIIANGVKRRLLNCPGEEEFTGRGVSYCATCDGAFFKEKEVAIVGGGNTALEDALFLANLCSKVYLIHRRDTFRAEQILADAVKAKENIEILYDTVTEEITGRDVVRSIRVKNNKTGEKRQLFVSAVFIAIGLIPDNQLFKDFIPLNEQGYLMATENCETNIPGVYAAGDTRSKLLRQIITAASDGAIAGFQAANYINLLAK